MTTASAARDVLREIHRELTSLLLVGAMTAPLVERIAGWPVHTPLGVPLLAHATALTAIALLRIGLGDRVDAPPAIRWVHLPFVPLVAVGFARLVHVRANVFYTEHLLVDGMTVLFTLHMAAGLLRGRARRRCDPFKLVERDSLARSDRRQEWRHRVRARCLPLSPAMWIADALTVLVGWLVLTSWVLIAFEHRHPAGPLLLAAGAMETLALLALVPDAMAPWGWLVPRPAEPGRPSDRHARTITDRRGRARRLPFHPHFFRRRS